ncbi:MAG: hypothetical protein CM1200mP29_16260 [Verrucomicrobiota bacterium]|nr:MAG: hypothetical protein CM1200mP29_16260 [Verrucomicrobiota bacterium]
MNPRTSRREDPRLGHMILYRISCRILFCRQRLVSAEESEGKKNRTWPSAGCPDADATALGQAHVRTSETTALESANASFSTPIRCAMVSSRLLKCASELTGLWYIPMPSS